MIRISERIERIARHVPHGARVVDVGTDHGLLPIHLLTHNIASFAIASDLREGPLASAQRNIRDVGLQTFIETRLGSGLTAIDPGEVDTAVIAGMGGKTIAEILRESPQVVRDLHRLVVQPMGASGLVRRFLLDGSFAIVHEEVFRHSDKFYELIVSEHGDAAAAYDGYETGISMEMAVEFGPLLLRDPTPDFTAFITEAKQRWELSLGNLQFSHTESAREREKWTEQRIAWISRWMSAHE